MDLSVIVCAYDMARELPRTIITLGPDYQRGIGRLDYEIIVVDNGSPQPVAEKELRRLATNVQIIRVSPASQSPARAINDAMRTAKGRVVGLFIDGARMASPGLLRAALNAYKVDPTKIIGSLAFHLGPDVQMRSVAAGYDQATEDKLLASVPWRQDGYTLFSVSVLAGSSHEGWFGTIAESNAVFLDRTLWDRLGGLDERFAAPGGGLVNLDFWQRAVAASDNAPCVVLGEGTFHQVHGGAATNGSEGDRRAMNEEYERIFGKPFTPPRYTPQLIGSLSPQLAERFGNMPPMSHRQASSVRDRSFEVGVPPDLLDSIQTGTLKMRYQGRRLAKNPFDLALYLRLLEKLRPRTIIEVGTSDGGSALWFRDQCRSLGLVCEILTMDIKPLALAIEDVAFFEVDATRPNETFPHTRISTSARPWLVIEDSAHTFASTKAILEYFHSFLQPADYLVVEDGVVAQLRSPQYRQYEDGPNRAVRDLLLRWPEQYQIDTEFCDFFGHNVTYCPNAWLVRR